MQKTWKKVGQNFYCYSTYGGRGFDAGKGEIYCEKSYGKICETGDMIEMQLNMNDLYVKYLINGEDYGKAFEVTPGSYRCAIYLYNPGDKLRII